MNAQIVKEFHDKVNAFLPDTDAWIGVAPCGRRIELDGTFALEELQSLVIIFGEMVYDAIRDDPETIQAEVLLPGE